MAEKLIDRKDIMNDLVNVVTPKYFPENTLDKNRTSIYGYVTEALAKSIEDTVTLEQRRAADYCPELSNSSIHVRETAKIRGVGINAAEPGKCFAIIGILKSDILEKGERYSNEIRFTIDRRSTIIHDGINFSLEDDIIIRAVKRSTGYVYAAAYSGEHSTYESYIQMFDQVNDFGQEIITMIVQIYQFNYNIQEKVVTDEIEFLYDGLWFDYQNYLADFAVYYKQSEGDAYKKLGLKHYLTTESVEADTILYNDDDDNILYILKNPASRIGINAMIRVEMKETLGTEGMITIGNSQTTFSLYRDGIYSYSGVNIVISMLSDTVEADNGDDLADIKARLIDAKTRRDNITTEHDIISYINDVDANVQIIKKRNDIEDRRYYMYTLLRHNKEIVPATTKKLHLLGIQNPLDLGDFDRYDSTVDRKVLCAYNKFRLIKPDDPDEQEYAIKVPKDENLEDAFYYTCPFMILINHLNIMSYYFTSVNDSVMVNMKQVVNLFPFQMICRQVDIYRDSHNIEKSDIYRLTIKGTMNTSNDLELVDEEGNILDNEAVVCYIIFRRDNTATAYMQMTISAYDQMTREFTFTGEMRTTDFITEYDGLEITNGLYQIGKAANYNSTIDFKDAFFEIYFMYKYDDVLNEYPRSDVIYTMIPDEFANGYVLMCGYYNNPSNPYTLVMEYSKFTSSPVVIEPYSDTTVTYDIMEVPFIEYNYGIENIIDMYPSFENMAQVYGSLLKLTTDFDVSLKFTATYGRSKYITVTGGRSIDGEEVVVDLDNLNPTFYFKVYGKNVDISEIRYFIYEYLRDTYITNGTVFISNICTLVEQTFKNVKSIKYMGVDKLDASFQEFVYTVPDFINIDVITRFVPEQLNVTDIQIDLDEN